MNKSSYVIVGGIAVLFFVILAVGLGRFNTPKSAEIVPPPVVSSDVKNVSYIIDGVTVPLVDGKASLASAPGSASRDEYAIFGEPVYGDLDGDADNDAVLYVTRSGGGSGTFFYLVGAVNDAGSYRGTNSISLGDRIETQGINTLAGRAVAHFLDRKKDEPFTTLPTIERSVWIVLDAKKYEIVEYVEPQVESSAPTEEVLYVKPWTWVQTVYADGKNLGPKQPGEFVMKFTTEGTVSIKTDCNTMGGKFVINGNTLKFSDIVSTRMYCEGSLEQDFARMVGDVATYKFLEMGELSLEFADGKGSLIML